MARMRFALAMTPSSVSCRLVWLALVRLCLAASPWVRLNGRTGALMAGTSSCVARDSPARASGVESETFILRRQDDEPEDSGGEGRLALPPVFMPSLGLMARPERMLWVRFMWTRTPGFSGQRGAGGCCGWADVECVDDAVGDGGPPSGLCGSFDD